MSDPPLPDHAAVVVIGAGVVGTSVAWHLARAGCADVVLLERAQVGSGTTWHAAGNMETWRADPLLGEMVAYTVRLFPELEADSGIAVGWRQTGRVHFTADAAVFAAYRAVPPRARARGVEVHLLGPVDVLEKLPVLARDGLLGGLWTPNDGRVDPTNLAMAYARGATKRGVRLVEDTPVTRILTRDGRVTGVATAKGEIRCDAVVLAGGLWSAALARTCGVRLPLLALQHFYLLTKPVPGLARDLPLFLSYDELLYGREDVGGLLLGVFDRHAIPVEAESLPAGFTFALLDENWEQIAPNLEILQRRFPLLATTEIRTLVNGPETFTPDGEMLLGELDAPRGLHLACAMNSNGIALAAGAGLLTAERILGRPPSLDAARLDPCRFASFQAGRRYRHARIAEIPFVMCRGEDPGSPVRHLRRSALHATHLADGAVLEPVAGHERPAWYTANGTIEAELAAAREAVARIDRSADVKLLLLGAEAAARLEALSGALDLDQDGIVRPLLLHDAGGVVLATPIGLRLGPTRWLLMAEPDALGWLHRALDAAATTVDVGAQWAALDLVGPAALTLLARIADGVPLPGPGRWRAAELALGDGLILHLPEGRWRVLVPSDMAGHLDAALRAEGVDLGLRPAGHRVDETLRILAGRPLAHIDTTALPTHRLVRARAERGPVEPMEPVLRGSATVGWISSAGLPVDGAFPVLALVDGPPDGLATLSQGEPTPLHATS